jgi:dipeptidyl aminopeptidase/acylaminoacyl peptidase
MRTPLPVATAVLLTAVTFPYGAAAAPVQEHAPSTSGRIVWTNRAVDGRERLMIAEADGSRDRVLTHPGKDVSDIDAQFSPNGRWIAYERDTPEGFSVRLVRPNGLGDHRLAVPCQDRCLGVANPSWLTNDRLAVARGFGPIDTSDNAAERLLWTVNRDGSRLRRLSPKSAAGKYEDGYVHPGPAGSYLVFMRRRLADGDTALFRMHNDGTHLQRITPWGLGIEVNDVSTATGGPTRNLVVFEAYGRGDPDATFVDLGFVPATCTSPKACRKAIVWLTDNGATGRRNANPHWSPDGRNLVFTDRANIDTEDVQIWTMRYGSTQRRLISNSPRFDYRPDWGRN